MGYKIYDAHAHIFPAKIAEKATQSIGHFYDIPMHHLGSAEELLRRGVAADRIHISMERNMKCGLGFCGHCQMESAFVCKDGPVFRYDTIQDIFGKREV